jgi:hypothetical protein
LQVGDPQVVAARLNAIKISSHYSPGSNRSHSNFQDSESSVSYDENHLSGDEVEIVLDTDYDE